MLSLFYRPVQPSQIASGPGLDLFGHGDVRDGWITAGPLCGRNAYKRTSRPCWLPTQLGHSERGDSSAADPSEFADAAPRVAMRPATAACHGRRGSPRFQSIAMPTDVTTTPSAFWATVAEHVSVQVGPAMKLRSRARGPVIAYLRDLEGIARRECDSRQIIQIIASGRHLLGDRTDIGPVDGPFSRT